MYSYEFCGNDAQYSHDCPPQVPFIYNPEPCYNQDFNFPQNFQSFQQQYSCCESCEGPHETFQCQQVIFYEPCCENYGDNLIESLLNQDSSIISSSKIDSLLDEFAGELIFHKSIPLGIDEADCDPDEEIYFSPSPIPFEDSDPFIEEIDLFLTSDGSIPPGIDSDYSDSEGDNLFPERLLHNDPILFSDILDFSNVVRIFLPSSPIR
nr:hypothetical protein [Tanacetum cinerariifolium]